MKHKYISDLKMATNADCQILDRMRRPFLAGLATNGLKVSDEQLGLDADTNIETGKVRIRIRLTMRGARGHGHTLVCQHLETGESNPNSVVPVILDCVIWRQEFVAHKIAGIARLIADQVLREYRASLAGEIDEIIWCPVSPSAGTFWHEQFATRGYVSPLKRRLRLGN